MENEIIKRINIILDDTNNIITEIRNNIFDSLGINTQYEKMIEFIKENLEKFNFNNIENNFFKQVKNIVVEEINKIEFRLSNNEIIDYDKLNNIITERLRQVKPINFYIEDDLKQLSNQLENRFPEVNISRDQFYSHFISKKEQIINIIDKYNQSIIDTIIKLNAQLVNEPEKTNQEEQTSSIKQTKTPILSETPQPYEQQTDNSDLALNNFRKRCLEKLNEIDAMFKNEGESKSEIAKIYRQLQNFIQSLDDKTFAQGILDKYMKLNEKVQETLYDEIIYHNIPMLKEIYEKTNVNNFEISKPPESPTPVAPNPISTYIGATNDEVEELIKQNKYFSLLQGIKKEDVGKYNGFIYTGYNILVDNWCKKASACKTYEEKHDAYFELYEIYQNFRNYISLEQSDKLKNQLDNIYNYLQQQFKTHDDIGIRYNNSQTTHTESAKKK